MRHAGTFVSLDVFVIFRLLHPSCQLSTPLCFSSAHTISFYIVMELGTNGMIVFIDVV